MSSTTRTARPRIDWDAVERDYRTGRFTNTELARKHSVDRATLSRKATKAGWQRDLTEVVRQATNAAVIAATVNAEITQRHGQVTDTVKAAAEVNTQVILGHRWRVQRAVDVVMRMLAELDATTLKAQEIEAIFVVVTEEITGPAKTVLAQQFRDFMRLHARVASAQKLMAALKDAQALEAQTFGLYQGKQDASHDDVASLSDAELEEQIAAATARMGLVPASGSEQVSSAAIQRGIQGNDGSKDVQAAKAPAPVRLVGGSVHESATQAPKGAR